MSATLRSLVRDLFDTVRDRERPCVLVVETRAAARARICGQLSLLGCTSREARTPLEAIDRLLTERPAIDAVAIGPGLTQTRADELAAYLRDAYPDLPVVIVDDEPRSSQRQTAPHRLAELSLALPAAA